MKSTLCHCQSEQSASVEEDGLVYMIKYEMTDIDIDIFREASCCMPDWCHVGITFYIAFFETLNPLLSILSHS